MKHPTCKRCGSEMVCLTCERETRAETAADLRRKRERAGISLREMARRLGRSKSYLHQFETGKAPGHAMKPAYLEELTKGTLRGSR